MLNIESIKSGLVIDHIRADSGAKIFSWLVLDKAEYSGVSPPEKVRSFYSLLRKALTSTIQPYLHPTLELRKLWVTT